MGARSSQLQLRTGHGIELKEDPQDDTHGNSRTFLVSAELPEGEADRATHLLECQDTNAEHRVRVNAAARMVSFTDPNGRWLPHEPFEFMGTCLPSLPQHTEHRCTDWHGLVLLFVTLAMLANVAHYGFTEGKLSRLSTAYDYVGRICGVDEGVEDKEYVFWCHSATEHKISLRKAICVSECPTSNETSHVCPVFRSGANTTAEHVQLDYATRNFGLSPYCWPVDKHYRSQVVHARSKKAKVSWFRGFLLIPPHAWIVFPVTTMTAGAMGYLYFRMLQKCVDMIVMALVLATVNLTIVLGFYNLYMQYTEHTSLLGLAAASSLVFAGLAFMRWLARPDAQKAINGAAGCIEAACECINQEFSLLIEPLIALGIRICVLVTLSIIMILIVTTGSPQRRSSGITQHWEFSQLEVAYCAFLVFVMLWFTEMSTSLSQYVLAWVAERWYFTPYVNDKKLDWERHAVLKGYLNALRYHLGSIVWGSLLISVTRPLRVSLAVFDYLSASCCPKRKHRHLRACRHFNKNAYLLVALTSDGFTTAARTAEHMAASDELAVNKYINGIQGFFQLGGLLAISVASGGGTLLIFEICPRFVAETAARHVMIALTMAISIPIGVSYMTLFDTVGDTILFCWAVQQTRYRYHMSHNIKPDAVDQSMVYGLLFGDESKADVESVNYAPLALRELLLGRSRRTIRFPWTSEV